jgi:hypothetical protein
MSRRSDLPHSRVVIAGGRAPRTAAEAEDERRELRCRFNNPGETIPTTRFGTQPVQPSGPTIMW